MKLEEKLAMQIGALVIENAKKDSIIEAMRVELASRNEIIKKLNEAEPDLPLEHPAANGGLHNGTH